MNKDLAFYYLADKPEYLPTVAAWYYKEWCEHSGRYSLSELTEKLEKSLNKSELPLSIIALKNDELVAAAELKLREMEAYPQYEHWLGGVYVAPEARGKQLATALVSYLLDKAKMANIETLYLQTEHLQGGLYCELGFKPLFETESKGYQVLVMSKEL
ncbi:MULTISPECIES: GNAT family N-acetyltransferase [Pseudoalteromonas]|uniref:Putative acyltransferase n=1 Tax=Pseudoalteromonas luteoviolacea (strain 2ta16) TaxID=1353533 RepID=V4H198_PSEL2|nr:MULTISPECIES: GNAT family N-acetyltransferase [Pseudoalteromonas]ESP91221.1 putative acyltransferase [Pseudoalteromonas luteoviolacea 2ta16]KZN31424.1 hypothetical protein N483_06305 [Pseudoalteromonas luteoviolacea NCIMB 1944]MCG7548671.1 GNAT family N-acetyltransferase [Pseudoalteromonas sp. Of7M-16]